MKIKSLVSLGAASVGALSILTNSAPATAAALVGDVSFVPTAGGGVILTGTGIDVPATNFSGEFNPLTELDFKLDNGTGGDIFELSGTGGFAPFIGFSGVIQDITQANFEGPIDNFIQIFDGDDNLVFSIDLPEDSLSFPAYSENIVGGVTNTTVSIGYVGTVVNELDGGSTSNYTGTLSADFPGRDRFETRALFDTAGEVFPTDGTQSWSSQGFAVEQVPEASNILGLLAFGLAGCTFIARKHRQIG